MSSLRQIAIDLLPHGVVRRIAQRRELARRSATAARRAAELRAVYPVARGLEASGRLNMGCGLHHEPGWINADADPDSPLVIRVVAGEPLPFESDSMEVVFSEHFLEHLSRRDGVWFLQESQRVLEPGGLFRVSCPDLDALVTMARDGEDSWRRLASVYESIGDFPPGELNRWERVLNWAFYGHEHRYLWSLDDLKAELLRVGFGKVERKRFGHSSMTGAAIERRIPEEFYSLIVEATKS